MMEGYKPYYAKATKGLRFIALTLISLNISSYAMFRTPAAMRIMRNVGRAQAELPVARGAISRTKTPAALPRFCQFEQAHVLATPHVQQCSMSSSASQRYSAAALLGQDGLSLYRKNRKNYDNNQRRSYSSDQTSGSESWWKRIKNWWQHKKRLRFSIVAFALWAFEPEYEDPKKMEEFLQQADEKKRKEVVEKVCNNPTFFAENRARYFTLKTIFVHIPDAAKTFTQPAANNFATLAEKQYGYYIVREIMKHNPETAKAFTQAAANNFAILAQNYSGCEIVREIIKHNPDASKALTQAAANNLTTLAQNIYGNYIVCEIIKHNPDAAKAFTQPAANNLANLVEKMFGNSIVRDIIKHNPDAAKTLAQSAANNLTTIAENIYGSNIVRDIIKHNPDAAKTLTLAAANNLTTLAEERHGYYIVREIIKHNPEAAKTFIQPALNNLTALAENTYGSNIVRVIIKHNPEAAKAFTQYALTNFVTLIEHCGGDTIVCKIIEHNPDAAKTFIQLALNNLTALAQSQYGDDIVRVIIKHNPEAIKLFQAKAQKHNLTKILDVIAQTELQQAMLEILTSRQTQTTLHFRALLERNLKKIKRFFPKQAESIHALQRMIGNIIKQEHTEQELGNYTFVHAYPWAIHFHQDIDAALRSIILKLPQQPVSLRFTQHPKEGTAQKHLNLRTILLKQRASRYYAREGNLQKHMIFMNCALFTNQHGSNTAQYLINDQCENPRRFKLKKLFENLGIAHCYKKYTKEFDELQQLHDDASMFGAGLMFSFTPEMLKESVYVCYGGGRKRKVHIEGIGRTDDVQLIIDTLRTHPEKIHDLDHLEFVFVLTKDCALNPRVQESEAYKVMPFNAADPEKLKLYEQKRDKLMAKIKADIEAERAKWTEGQRRDFQQEQEKTQAWYDTYNCLECRSPICESRVQEAI